MNSTLRASSLVRRITAAACAALLWGLAPSPAAKAASSQPNVIVVLADDQRWDYLASAGHPVLRTPNLDALASGGIRFVNAFAPSAACTPSRTSILTGQYERRHGVTFESRSALTEAAFERTYPMVLKRAGYHCGYVGKNHTPAGRSGAGIGYASGYLEGAFDFWRANHNHSFFYPKERHPIYRDAAPETQIEIFENAAMEFLRQRPRSRPFCLLLNFNAPHNAARRTMESRPNDPQLYRTAYRDRADAMPVPATYLSESDASPRRLPVGVYNGIQLPEYDFVKTRQSLCEAQIRACQLVEGIDRALGTIRAEVEAMGEGDNTIIIYLSDNGEMHGEHGMGGKVIPYEEPIRIPLILLDPRLPAVRRGTVVEEIVLTIDIAPTLLDLAGVAPPRGIQGRSLRPLMEGLKTAWRDDFLVENLFMGQNYPRIEGVRSTQWKYLRYFDKRNDAPHHLAMTASVRGEKPIHEELFDLTSDPGEVTNLADDPAHLKELERLRARCQTLVADALGDGEPDTYSDAR